MYGTFLKYITDAGRLYQRLLAPVRTAGGLTQTELDILLFLANQPDYDTASDIVAVRRLAKSNVSVGIRSLEDKGLLLRRPDQTDRRVEHLELTSAAHDLTKLGREKQQEFGHLLLQDFSPSDLSRLEQLMDHIQNNVTQALDHLDRL